MSIDTSVKEAWAANEKMNKILLEHLTNDMLSSQTPGGG
jgi:hypothetical protein